MQDRESSRTKVRALANLSGVLSGLMLILVGSLIPSGILIPWFHFPPKILNLPSTWQVPALLICSLVTGPRSGVISAVAYITVGLTQLPVFHGGGDLSYVLNPGFGYIAGFIPAAWLTGKLAKQKDMNDHALLTLSAISGLALIHICGLLNLFIGYLLGRWPNQLLELIFTYTFAPLPAQLVICPAIAIIALVMRRILFI